MYVVFLDLRHRDGPETRGTILPTCLHKEGERDNHAADAEVGNPGTN